MESLNDQLARLFGPYPERQKRWNQIGPGRKSILKIHERMAQPRKQDRAGYCQPNMAGSTEDRHRD